MGKDPAQDPAQAQGHPHRPLHKERVPEAPWGAAGLWQGKGERTFMKKQKGRNICGLAILLYNIFKSSQ